MAEQWLEKLNIVLSRLTSAVLVTQGLNIGMDTGQKKIPRHT